MFDKKIIANQLSAITRLINDKDSHIRGIDNSGSFLKPINIGIAGIINIIFRIGYAMTMENKTMPLEEDNTDKLIVIYTMYGN